MSFSLDVRKNRNNLVVSLKVRVFAAKSEKMTGKYLDPKADLVFKLVFGEHKDLAMSLLNALLPLSKDEQITELEYATPEMASLFIV